MTETEPQPSKPSPRFFLFALGGVALLAVIAIAALTAGPSVLDRARRGEATFAADGVQEIQVRVAQGVYTPNVIFAKAGRPLRIRVEVRERHSCATKLLVPDLKLDFDLPPQGTVDVLVPAAPAGSYLFTCGKKMVKGSIVLE
jgi:plastocyanin domain-containing protein